MEITEFLAIGIVGVTFSLLVEVLQRKFGTASVATRAIAITGSVILATGYVLARHTPWFPTFITILSTASMIYAMFFSGNSSKSSTNTAV